jgi:hypothetical protein
MLFLIHYDRKNSKVLTRKEYQDNERAIAVQDRLAMERLHNLKGGEQEIVLLEAVDAAQLRKTHPKYVPMPDVERLFWAGAAALLMAALS